MTRAELLLAFTVMANALACPAHAENEKTPEKTTEKPYPGQTTIFNGEPLAIPAVFVDTTTHTGRPAPEAEKADPAQLDIVYTADGFALVRGGLRKGTRYLDNLDVTANVDFNALGWIPRTTFYAYMIYNNGQAFSGRQVGDAFVASNIETGVQAVRLYEAWLQHDLPHERGSLRFGLYDLNSEFDALESANLFINSAHGIGVDISQSGQAGPSIFPLTSLSARLEITATPTLKFRVAVLDGVPGDPDRPRRTTVKLGNGDGALAIGEVDYTIGATRVIAGYWRYSAPFAVALDSARAGVLVTQRGNDGAYIRAESKLTTEGKSEGQGLSGFMRLGWADPRFNDFGSFYSAGLVYTGAIPGRNEDQLGLAIAYARTTGRAKSLADLDGASLAPNETNIELTYRAPITSWLTVQPDVQYIVNPGLDPSLKNAVAIGVRAEVALGF